MFINEQEAVKNAQLVWLRDALANSQARWKVVFLHHSIYSAATRRGGHGGERSVLRLRRLLEPVFVDGRVDLVLPVTIVTTIAPPCSPRTRRGVIRCST